MSDIHELKFLQDQLQELKDQGVYRKIPIVETANEAQIIVNGQKVINLSSNNYLGFANHPRLKQAAIDAVNQFGVGAGAVKTIVGNMSLHERLETELAVFKREEAVLLFQSGFNCNAGVIQAVTAAGDLIISDALNHASIIDGVRLSKADRAVYKHSDMQDLRTVLQEMRANYKQVLIITDGVFSMDGDLAKLPEIVDLAEEFNCLTYVDDAHGSGVLGENGRGTIDHFHLHGRVDFTIGTLSKAFGVIGGYVAGKQVLKDWLSHRARPLLFSTNLPPAVVGALLEGLKMLNESDEYTKSLWDNSVYFKARMKEAGFDIGHSETPITPVFIHDEALTVRFSKRLFEKGVFVSPILFPTVPKGKARLRVMVTAQHTKKQLDESVAAFIDTAKEFGLLNT
jgi:glycine C-acetyltransferase